MSPGEPAPGTAATRRQLTETAERVLGRERAAELADRIALLASHVALVSAQDDGWLSPRPRHGGNAGRQAAR